MQIQQIVLYEIGLARLVMQEQQLTERPVSQTLVCQVEQDQREFVIIISMQVHPILTLRVDSLVILIA
jgi:hypothetical protein